MIPNHKTSELNSALAQYQNDENDATLLHAIDDAIKEGYLVTVFYKDGGRQFFGDRIAVVTTLSMVGSPIYVLAERPELKRPMVGLADLTEQERQHIEHKLEAANKHLSAAIMAVSGLHLFEAWKQDYHELQQPINLAKGIAQQKLDAVRQGN